jgi:hypothetical protein
LKSGINRMPRSSIRVRQDWTTRDQSQPRQYSAERTCSPAGSCGTFLPFTSLPRFIASVALDSRCDQHERKDCVATAPHKRLTVAQRYSRFRQSGAFGTHDQRAIGCPRWPSPAPRRCMAILRQAQVGPLPEINTVPTPCPARDGRRRQAPSAFGRSWSVAGRKRRASDCR